MDFSIMPDLLPLVAYANFYQFRPAERVKYPRVESRMLLWCKSGRGRVTVNGQAIVMTPGDYAVLPWRHRIAYEADKRSPFQLAGVHVIPHYAMSHPVEFDVAHDPGHPVADRHWRRDVTLPGFDSMVTGSFASHPALQHLAEYIVVRFNLGHSPNAEEMRQLAKLLLTEIQRPAQAPSLEQRPLPLRQMMQWVERHLDAPSNLPALAEIGGCSVATARRMFRQHLGLSPLAWISRTKLEHAAQLLRTTSLPMTAIATRVGIADAYYFSRWFRRQTGRSPRETRQGQLRL